MVSKFTGQYLHTPYLHHYIVQSGGIQEMGIIKIEVPENQEELLRQYQLQQQIKVQEGRNKYRKVVQAGIAKWISNFQQGKIRLETVGDLRQLIEMDEILQRE